MGQISPPPVVVDKVLLEHRHIFSFTIVYGCFYVPVAEVSSYNRDHVTCTPEKFTVWPSTEEVRQPLTDRICPGEKLAHPAESQTPLEGHQD